jgi:FkbM family methyltransferase
MIKIILKNIWIKTKFLAHTAAIFLKILSGNYPYNKVQLIRIYLSLIYKAYKNNWQARNNTIPNPSPFTKKIFKYDVSFVDYPQIITLFEEIFIEQVYRFTTTTENPVIIDCGSNIGLSIIYFKSISQSCTIYGFEPHKETFDLLKINVNKLQNVHVFNVALSNYQGDADLYSSPARKLNMTLQKGFGTSENTTTEQVAIDLLSNYISKHINLIKIDVEGSETDIIQELISSGKILYVSQLIVEHHSAFLADSLDGFIHLIECSGFTVLRKMTNQISNETILHFKRK